MKRIKTLVFAYLAALSAMAGNNTTSIEQVVDVQVVSEATDFHITSTNPFGTSGSVDLVNTEGVIIIDAVKPSLVKKNWLPFIKINGQPAQHNVNCRVGIYENGTIIYPHPNTGYTPLTVFSQKDFEGESSSDFEQTKYYNGLGKMTNNIRSIKLKRGYMATLACDSIGTGYSRVFIAQDSDLEIADLGKNLAGRVAFIRIFPWNKVTKKGLGGVKSYNHLLNATWSWNWGASNLEMDDEEYVPSHEQENWPSWKTIMAIDKSNHLLGHCEPDNKVGEHITVAQIEDKLFKTGSWQRMYQTGMRVVSPAPGGGDASETVWLDEFMRCCKEYNCRIDAVAVHKYWYASGNSFNSDMNNLYNRYKVPIWITEWNYGGNWTKEKWPDEDRTGTAKNYAHALAGIKSICSAFESNSHVERYSIYNWVQDCRKIYNDADSTLKDKGYLTPAGEYYAALKSKPAYTNGDNYVMKWNYKNPSNLALSYDKQKHNVALSWTHLNGKQTDSIRIERKIEDVDEDFVAIKTYPMTEKQSLTFSKDNLDDVKGLVKYRIHDFDSDGKERFSEEVSVLRAVASGNSHIQYGDLLISDANDIDVELNQRMDTAIAVFAGLPTMRNTKLSLSNQIKSITRKSFAYQAMPWQFQKDSVMVFTKSENVDYIAITKGHHTYGNMEMEIGTGFAKSDTTQILFEKPFPVGTIPVVVPELVPSVRTYPISCRIWDVTNEGFKVTAIYEIGNSNSIDKSQTLNYLASTPGTATIDDTLTISAGISDQTLSGQTARKIPFIVNSQSGTPDSLHLANPKVIGSLQTFNYPAATSLRLYKLITEENADGETLTTGIQIRRYVDTACTTPNTTSTADTFGWFAISQRTKEQHTGITKTNNENEMPTKFYTIDGVRISKPTMPGMYIMVKNGKSQKILIAK